MRALVEFLAKSLVDSPDAVELREYERDRTTILEMRVAQGDLGKVIGRQGRTAKALRTIMSNAGAHGRKRYQLDIVD